MQPCNCNSEQFWWRCQLRNDKMGAWGLRGLKTGILEQKLCSATNVAEKTQLCTTECTVDTLEQCTCSGGIDRQMVSETGKGQKDKAAGDRSNFAQLGKDLEECVQSQLKENNFNDGVLVEPKDEL